MMGQHWFYWILFCFSISWAQNISIQFENQKYANFGIENRGKKNIEIYSNLTEFNNKNDEEIVNVCEEKKKGAACACFNNQVDCMNFKHSLNIKAVKENFIPKVIIIRFGNISLKKNKIFPTNVETIEHFVIDSTRINPIENGAFDGFSSMKTLEIREPAFLDNIENILTPQLGKTLKKLTFSYPVRSAFDPSILKNLVNLEELDFSGNVKFGGNFENQFPESLSNLKTLHLLNSELDYLRENIFDNLRNLKHLDLGFNKFTSIPSAINVLSNLKTLNFCGNPIEKYERNSFNENSELENLLLGYNSQLKSIEDCAFCKLPNLKVINFYLCDALSQIHENAFGSISNEYAPKINEFSIEHCNMSVLPEKLLDWKNVEKILMIYNPFACNCSNAWLFNDLLSNNSIYENRLSTLSARFTSGNDHPKYTLGCIPRPTSPNHTISLNISEIFSSCETSTKNNHFWIFIIFGVIFITVFIGIYSNHLKLPNYYSNLIVN